MLSLKVRLEWVPMGIEEEKTMVGILVSCFEEGFFRGDHQVDSG